jgi:hypothetical protein
MRRVAQQAKALILGLLLPAVCALGPAAGGECPCSVAAAPKVLWSGPVAFGVVRGVRGRGCQPVDGVLDVAFCC